MAQGVRAPGQRAAVANLEYDMRDTTDSRTEWSAHLKREEMPMRMESRFGNWQMGVDVQIDEQRGECGNIYSVHLFLFFIICSPTMSINAWHNLGQ